MKRYMCVMLISGEQSVYFTDSWDNAKNTQMDCECAVGGVCEIYEYVTNDGLSYYDMIS